jgi:hypothetical protein
VVRVHPPPLSKKRQPAHDGYGVFSSICIPRLVATIRHLQQDVAQASKERDDALALLRNVIGESPTGGAPLL